MLAAGLLALALLAPAPLQAQVPDNDGWVTDLAGMLTPAQEQSLEQLMESYRSGTTHELAVLLVPDLGGRAIETYALEVARAWGVGTGATNNGALLVVAKQERKLRWEVGTGLEGDLPDIICGRIIRDVIVPRMRAGQTYEAVRAGLEAAHAAIGGDYGPIQRTRGARDSAGDKFGALLFLAFLVFWMIAAVRGRGRRAGLGGGVLYGGLGGFGGGRGGGGFGGGGGGGFGGFGGGGFGGGGASGGW